MIDYIFEENFFSKDKPNDRYARVVNQHSYTEKNLAAAIAGMNIGISMPEALAAIEAGAEIIFKWLAEGNSVNLKTAHYHFSIPGVYEEDEHPKEAILRITPSKELAEIARKIPLRHVEPTARISVSFMHDVKSNTTNDKVTRGGAVKISGHNLKIAGTDSGIGAWFISCEDPEAIYRIPPVDLVTNHPSELLIVAPAGMVVGERVVFKVATQYAGSGTLLKEPRSITFERELTVV